MSGGMSEVSVDRHLLRLLLPLFSLAWLIQRFLLPFLSTWLPLLLAAWAAFQYERYRRNTLLEDLNNRWKRQILYISPKTPLEPCEWVNKLITKLWPNYIEERLSQMLSITMMKRLKEKRPHPFHSIELQEFSLGVSPPNVGMQRTYWSNELDEQAFHMGFEWETSGMKVLLAAKLAGPFKGVARFVINSLYIKGDLRIVPILDGQAFVYSFVTCPEVRIGLAFGGGQSDPATELPPAIASWLEKLFLETLMRTMVEPRRRCFPLSAVSLKKHASGGVISITVLSAKNMNHKRHFKRHSNGRLFTNGSGSTSEGSSSRPTATFVEVTLEGLTRSTHASEHSGSPRWNHTFNMILHESVGTVRFNVYDQGSSNVKYDFRGSCEVKVERKTKISQQDLNPLWRQSFEFPELGNGDHLQLKCFDADYFSDENLGSARVNLDGLEHGVVRDVWIPLEKVNTGEIRLLIEAFTSELEAETSQNDTRKKPSMDFQRGILEVVLLEARDLVAADLCGTSDPFVVLHCGEEKQMSKIAHKTLHPQWNQTFEMSDTGKPLILSVKDHNVVLPDVSIGRCAVEYERLPQNQMVDKWIPLQGARKGEIHVQVMRRSPRLCSSVSATSIAQLTTVSKILQKFCKVQALLKQVLILSSTGNTDAIGEKLEEIEIVEAEKSMCLSGLVRERDLLLAKIRDLGHVLHVREGHQQTVSGTS